MAVREVAAMGEVHPQDRVARLNTVKYTAMLAWAPECGWTLAWSAPNNSLARAIASVSATSTNSQPP